MRLTNDEYQSALSYLYSRINYEKIGYTPYTASNYRLDRMRQLLAELGNPHQNYDIVHVAGTKGKGTTANLLADCLLSCGKRTGLYTSPHLLRLEERICFQGQPCTPAELVLLTKAVRSASRVLEERGGGISTFFEMTTAMGLMHFANCKAEVVVLEVGLGGRLDSTNVVTPIVSVITSISLDHQAQLGNTIDLIAREKAGIIKVKTPVVCVARAPEAREAIIEVAANKEAPLKLIGRDFEVGWQVCDSHDGSEPCRAKVTFASNPTQNQARLPTGLSSNTWHTSLIGRHQADNIGGALATLETLQQIGWDLPVARLKESISKTQPSARLQIVSQNPISIVDSAHNPASIEAGLLAIREHFPDRELTIIFAASRDKDWASMLRVLLRSCKHMILTAYHQNPRALPIAELQDLAMTVRQEIHSLPENQPSSEPTIEVANSPQQAWLRAQELTSPSQLMLATGSFFLAAELMAAWE